MEDAGRPALGFEAALQSHAIQPGFDIQARPANFARAGQPGKEGRHNGRNQVW